MKHIVFIVGSFHPNYSAVGVCALRVIECLKKDFLITVIAIRGDIHQELITHANGIDIIKVETPSRRIRMNLAARSGWLHRKLLNAFRAMSAVKKILSVTSIERPLVNAYVRALDALDLKPDIIIPLVFPFETVLAALKVKNRRLDTLVYPYIFDDFVDSGSLHVHAINRKLKENRHITLEREMLDQSDAVLAMHPLFGHFTRHFGQSQLGKIHFLEHPLLSRPQKNVPTLPHSDVRLIYAGSLIRNVREPDYLLDLLHLLKTTYALTVDFYVMGNLAGRIKPRTVRKHLEILNHGTVDKETALSALLTCDILLNLGEAQGKQVSSKVFEYMATGKPIIHLAYVENDSVSSILGKYPLALCLVQVRAQIESNARKCEEFINRHKNSRVDYSDVAALYPEALPSTTADLMRDLFAKGAS